MRKYKYLFLLLGGLTINSCSDLEEEPEGLLSGETFFDGIETVNAAVDGVFVNMHSRFFLTRETGMALMLRSDMMAIADPATRQERIDHDDFTDLPSNGNTDVSWPIMFDIVSSANLAIAKGNELEGIDPDLINPVIAKARFGRALAYYHLVRQFGAIPLPTEPITDAVEAANIMKSPVEDVYEVIIADLEFAKIWLPTQPISRSLPGKAAASGYLASVYLTMAGTSNTEYFTLAYNEANDLIGNEGSYNVGLDPDFQNLFNYETSSSSIEPLFILDYNNNGSLGDFGTDYMAPLTSIDGADNQDGWSVMAPAIGVYDAWDDNDYRKTVSFIDTFIYDGVDVRYDRPLTAEEIANPREAQGLPTEEVRAFIYEDEDNVNRPYCAKYSRHFGPSGDNGRASSLDYMLMRYAEVLLIAAEAGNEIGDPDGNVHSLVNRVRARARSGGVTNGNVTSAFPEDIVGLGQDDFRTMVLEERRLELAFEQKRWYDIVRRRMGTTVFSASGLEGTKNFSEDDYLIAIPADEVAINPNLGL